MSWKKILITAAILMVVLITAAYVILLNLDFNRYKPQIAQLVFEATGRKLTIEGNIDVAVGIRPTLVVENVGFENAGWGSLPDLARVKRLEAQLAFLPLIWGKLDFAHLVLIEPEVIVEFDSQGTSNFAFDTSSDEKAPEKIPVPPLIFSDILVEKGNFIFQDRQSDIRFSVRIDSLEGQIEGFDKPLRLDFKGAFDEIPLSLEGTVGPIWAWVESGYPLPANLTATAGGATATIVGELRDPINIKDLAFNIAARGSSVAEIARLAGLSGVPKLGAFNLTANLNDSAGRLAVEKVDIQIGSRALVALALTGEVKDVFTLQGVNLNFAANAEDSANLSRFGLPALPVRGPVQLRAQISDPEAKVLTTSDLSFILNEYEVNGQLNLNLAGKVPFLAANLTSQTFGIGPFNLDFKMSGPVEKPVVKKLDLNLGTPDLAEIRLNGTVDDLINLQGVKINFKANGKDLANLEKLTGQPLPVRGAFKAAGKVLIPVHKKLQIPNLKVTAGNNNITGSLNLDISAVQPLLDAKLSLPKLDLPSVLLPKHAKAGWARGLSQVRPVRLDARLAGFARDLAVKKIDLQAGTLKSAELRLNGSVENLPARRGIDLNFSLQGKEFGKLKEIIAQPYIFAPVPGQGAYAISGNVSDSKTDNYKVTGFKFKLADTELTGWLNFNLAAQPPQYEVELSAQKFNLKPFPIPKEAAYANLNKIDDLGPLKLRSKVSAGKEDLYLQHLELQAGNEQLVAVDVNGSIKSLTKQTGIDLNFNIRGTEVANLKKITGHTIPLEGPFGLTGKFTDPAQKKYRLGDLKLKLGTNNISGSIDLNLSGQQLKLATALSSPQFNLQPVTVAAIEPLTRIGDLGPLELSADLSEDGDKIVLQKLNLTIGSEQLIAVSLKGKINDLRAVSGMELDFSLRGQDLDSISTLGGPALPFPGPFNVSGRLVDPAPKNYKIPSLHAVWGDNDGQGWIAIDLSKDRPHISAELSSQKLDLRPLFDTPAEKSSPDTPAPEPEPKKNKFFSSEPFELEELKLIDANIKFRGKQILLPPLALDDNNIGIMLDNGNLQLKPFSFTVGGGKADIRIDLRLRDNPPTLVVAKVVDQLDIGLMLEKLGYSRSLEGMLDTRINLSGRGVSPAELMAGLNGSVIITMVDGQASSRYLDLLQKYLGSSALQLLNPFKSKREFAPINCFVNNIQITDGLADVKLLLDTDQTSIFGLGDVNLKTEKLNLGIKPTPKKTYGVSFSLKELSQPFRLGGTLTQPALGIAPGRTAKTMGKLAGALALGPFGLAAFFGDVSVGKKDPCPLALEAVAQESQTADDGKKGGQVSDKEGEKEKKSGRFYKRQFRK
jgi:uncharacterized protein involved in outer membrane biogenesis